MLHCNMFCCYSICLSNSSLYWNWTSDNFIT